uniref:Palmitoyltransferase n=1 Tax=Anopheles culicifacies TaxID=139723 RepID=A0A182M5R1_9DIPT
MVTEESDHPHHPEEEKTPTQEKDSNLLARTDSSEILIQSSMDDIFDVIKSGELSEVENLVEKVGQEALSARDKHGYTPAHWAALDGNVEMMRYLVERNAPVDLPCLGTQGPRPIHWACRKGHAAVVQVLLQAGVAVNAADFKGLTPLMTACMYGRTATAAYLLGMGAQNHLTDINGDTALHWAAYKGHADLIRLLMYSGVDLQKTDNFGSTPLHLACLSGNLQCVKILCEKRNLELEPRDKNGKTPVMLAQSHRNSEVVKLLHNEMKKKSRWMPPISEIWGMLFGGAGASKGPLILFLVSVLLWGYPMYMIRCIPITWNILRRSHYCFIYWNAVMWISWIIANRRDPGYIPLNSDTYYRAIKQIPYFDKWKKRNVILSRLCHSCRCLRPLRAKHCRICNRCVSYFDHHCPFIYNCVGLRNRMWFLLFVLSIAINCSFTIYFACYCVMIEGFSLLYVLGLLEAFVFCGLGWILTCTSILHACMNLTTNEMFNYKRYPYLRDKQKATKRKASALELIPQHQKLVQLVGKKGKKVEKDMIRRREKLTVTDVRQQLANRRDPTEDNVKKLIMLTSFNLDDVSRETILKRARTGHYVSRVRVPKGNRQKDGSANDVQDTDNQDGAGESVFTEDDFANFAKELEKSGLLH